LWLADRMGWTLEYIDALDHAEAYEMIDILQQADVAQAQNQRKASRQARR